VLDWGGGRTNSGVQTLGPSPNTGMQSIQPTTASFSCNWAWIFVTETGNQQGNNATNKIKFNTKRRVRTDSVEHEKSFSIEKFDACFDVLRNAYGIDGVSGNGLMVWQHKST
jgi:hypothetical protein